VLSVNSFYCSVSFVMRTVYAPNNSTRETLMKIWHIMQHNCRDFSRKAIAENGLWCTTSVLAKNQHSCLDVNCMGLSPCTVGYVTEPGLKSNLWGSSIVK